MFRLYYLVDQNGDINGDKTLAGSYSSLAAAQAQASSDAVAHYSVEENLSGGADYQIVFIC